MAMRRPRACRCGAGIVTSNTTSLKVAVACSALMPSGKGICRRNIPVVPLRVDNAPLLVIVLGAAFAFQHEGRVGDFHPHVVLRQAWKVRTDDEGAFALKDLHGWRKQPTASHHAVPATAEPLLRKPMIHLLAEAPHESKGRTPHHIKRVHSEERR